MARGHKNIVPLHQFADDPVSERTRAMAAWREKFGTGFICLTSTFIQMDGGRRIYGTQRFEVWRNDTSAYVVDRDTWTYYPVALYVRYSDYRGRSHPRWSLSIASLKRVPGLIEALHEQDLFFGINLPTTPYALLSRVICAMAGRNVRYHKKMARVERLVVHHINEHTDDDRLSNLKVMIDEDHENGHRHGSCESFTDLERDFDGLVDVGADRANLDVHHLDRWVGAIAGYVEMRRRGVFLQFHRERRRADARHRHYNRDKTLVFTFEKPENSPERRDTNTMEAPKRRQPKRKLPKFKPLDPIHRELLRSYNDAKQRYIAVVEAPRELPTFTPGHPPDISGWRRRAEDVERALCAMEWAESRLRVWEDTIGHTANPG